MEKSTLVPQVKKNTTRKILNSNPIISVITLNKNELNSLIVKDETRFFFFFKTNCTLHVTVTLQG